MANGIKKNDISREKLITLITKYIKECSKKLNETTSSIDVSVSHENWYSGCGNNAKFSSTNISFGGNEYCFYDKEISDNDFVTIMKTALKDSKCKGKVNVQEWDTSRGWSTIHCMRFKSLVLLGKPCKEFGTLNRMIKKYTNKELGETDVNSSSVCGKRSSWSVDGSSTGYLCYQPKKCQFVIDFIREKKTSRDKLHFEVKNELSHGNGHDYEIAQYQESEWYGTEFNFLKVEVSTPTGKTKGTLDVYANVKAW